MVDRSGWFWIAVAACLFAAAPSSAAELYDDQDLLAEPRVGAPVAGKGSRGEVKVVERRGYWVELKSGDVTGWTQLDHVKMDETTRWMTHIDTLHDTGRLGVSE